MIDAMRAAILAAADMTEAMSRDRMHILDALRTLPAAGDGPRAASRIRMARRMLERARSLASDWRRIAVVEAIDRALREFPPQRGRP